MRGKGTTIVLTEGETEKNLILDLRRERSLSISRVSIINLWNREVRALLTTFTSKCNVIVVYDIDQINNISRFVENLNLIKARGHSLFLFQQNNNFEDEIAHSCSCSTDRLFKEFCPKSQKANPDNFKNNFNKCSNRLDKLERLNFNRDKVWGKHREIISGLKAFSKHHSSYVEYPFIIIKCN